MKDLKDYVILEDDEAQVEKEEQKELAELPEDEKYGIIETGGSIGSHEKDNYWHVGSVFGKLYDKDLTKDEATEKAKKLRKRLSSFERKYYGMGYRVVPMSKLKKVESK